MSIEKIIKRIKSLLAMASDTSSPNEAAIAARRAQSLMAQYQIDNFDLIKDQISDDENIVGKFIGPSYNKTPFWLDHLACNLAEVLSVQVERKYNQQGRLAWYFTGFMLDIEMVEFLFPYVIYQIELQTKVNCIVRGADYKINFKWGISREVCNKIKHFYQQEKVTELGNALVVCKQNAISKKFGHRPVTTGKILASNPEAIQHGIEAAANVNVSRTVSASNRLLT